MFRINDIFYSLQGEGHNTGRAAVFVRFAGCNLRCPFCDTEFDTYREMTVDDIVTAIKAQLQIGHQTSDFRHLVVLTGGEPTLQVDEAFVDLLHQHGFEVAMESNGTRPAPRNLDWLTVSPKEVGGAVVRGSEGARFPDELKIIFDENTNPETFLVPPYLRTPVPPYLRTSVPPYLRTPVPPYPRTPVPPYLRTSVPPYLRTPVPPYLRTPVPPYPLLYLQPCDTGDAQRNAAIVDRCIDYIKAHPQWRLSLQTHKLVGFK